MKPVLFWFVHLVLIEVEHFEQKKESAGTKQLLQIVCKTEVYRSYSADRCALRNPSDDEANPGINGSALNWSQQSLTGGTGVIFVENLLE